MGGSFGFVGGIILIIFGVFMILAGKNKNDTFRGLSKSEKKTYFNSFYFCNRMLLVFYGIFLIVAGLGLILASFGFF